MEEGTVVQWLVNVGESVERGQPLVEIDTDKATMSYEAEESGVLVEIIVAEGGSAPIGAPIARIGAPGETVTATHGGPAAAASPQPPVPSPSPRIAPREGARENASPVARRLAEELGVDLATLSGSGPGGSITKADVERAARAAETAPASSPAQGALRGESRVVQLTRLQKTIARRMVEGAGAPDFAVEVEIDMTACLTLRAELAQGGGGKPSLNDFVVKAVAVALRHAPRLNATYTEAGFELHPRINIGIAVATDDGLVVPTIFDADAKPLAEIGREARGLAAKVRDGTITPAELDGGTFTVTNLGMFGVRRFHPILNPPQAGILAVGDVAKRPVAGEDGALTVRDLMTATLVCDHRIVYGADAARFLGRVRELLEQPAQLV